jgi:predicted nuclease of predicted toxin-antitoxin system
MKLKLDENLSRHLKSTLAVLGHEVDTVAEECLLSRPDSDIAAAAKTESRVLFTLDLDFADLRRFPPGVTRASCCFSPSATGHWKSIGSSKSSSGRRI